MLKLYSWCGELIAVCMCRVTLPKEQLDVACADTKHKLFSSEFGIEINLQRSARMLARRMSQGRVSTLVV